jgi:acetylornithine/N-succinyldiaminopimelate aminotransferase
MLELIQARAVCCRCSRITLGVLRILQKARSALNCRRGSDGVGRTGTLFAFQQYGIKPDVVTFAKGIAGGLPWAAFSPAKKSAGVLTSGTHAATFGGNPVVCAGALEVLAQLTPELLDGVKKKGALIWDTIES